GPRGRAGARAADRGAQGAAPAAGPQRRPRGHRRDPRCRGRRGGGPVRPRPVRDVPGVRGPPRLELRGALRPAVRPRRVLRGDVPARRRGRLVAHEVRGRTPPGAARPGHRVAGPRAHLLRDGRRAARGGRGGGPARPRRSAGRRVPLLRARWAVGQHHRLGRAAHPPADGARGVDAGREEPAAEPGEGDDRAAVTAAAARAGAAGGRGGRPEAGPDRWRWPQREGPHLQLQGEPGLGPPRRPHRVPPRPGPGGRAGRDQRRARDRRPGPPTRGGRPMSPAPAGTVTWRELLGETVERLRAAGIEHAESDARRIVAEASGAGSDLPLVLSDPATQGGVARLDRMVARRSEGEPLQYVLGSWGFRSLDLMVDRRVLIPRPETEVVVEVALGELDRLGARDVPTRVVDLGTGRSEERRG